MTEQKRKVGRPVEPVPQDKMDSICAWVSEGKVLAQWCRENGVDYSTPYGWMEKSEEFRQRFARARKIGLDRIADETLEIADTPLMGLIEETSERGLKITKQDMLGHRKLQIETRMNLLAKWNPEKYGNKVSVSGDAENPLKVEHTIDVSSLPTDVLAQIVAAKDAKTGGEK